MQKEYLDGVANLTAFVEGSNRKFSAPIEVSFVDVKMFLQDLEVKEYSCALLYECQHLLSPLEEQEKQITNFYESLEKVNEIISILDPEAQPTTVLKQKAQDLVAYQENCKKALSLIERNSQSILQCVASSEVLQHFHQSTFQKKVTQVQITFQVITLHFGA
ncbi:hypothetical protein ASZ78_001813 [Callipepla squamata]|uniref:Uncharacterized protein n=1 Tax=Callipepla squamata TaxID=9009 RepID=A0A226MYJ9_CALSU|nr:hypothetical protein ASZ78_001813 [Callipepla squamata]